MTMPRPGTNTNSNDPQSLRSRVFVGNIDSAMSRDEIESIFQRYGTMSALSVHKGFAFVQYNDELSARAAVFGEDNKKYYTKYLDCNVASEPKPNRKRVFNQMSPPESCSQVHPYLAATAQALAAQTSAIPLGPNRNDYTSSGTKFARIGTDLTTSGTRSSNLVSLVAQTNPQKNTRPLISLEKEAPSKDILICGSCKTLFENYDTLINHKAHGCRLRFICRCKQMGEPKSLSCSRCLLAFRSSWELVLHHVSVHGTSLFIDEERHCQMVPVSSDTVDNVKDLLRGDSVKVQSTELANGQVEGGHGSRSEPAPTMTASEEPKTVEKQTSKVETQEDEKKKKEGHDKKDEAKEEAGDGVKEVDDPVAAPKEVAASTK